MKTCHVSLPLRGIRQGGRSRIGVLALVVVLAAAVAGGAWWWKRHHDAQAIAAPAGVSSAAAGGGAAAAARRFAGGVQPVSVAAARRQDMRVLLSAIGTIAAPNTAVVRPKADGELKAIRFREGDTVRAGQLLAEIDARTYQAQLAQVQGNLARDQAQLRNAQLDLQRYQELLAQDSIAQQQVATQEALVRQLQGTVQADQAQVDAAKLTLSYTRVTAPIAGRLGLKQADLGNLVRATDTNGIVTITQTQPINAVFAIPEAALPQVARKLRAGEALPVEAWDRERRQRLAAGEVRFVDNAIDTATGTIRLKAVFPNTDNALFPNQFVNVLLQTDLLEDALQVPTAAVQRGTQGTYVYAVDGEGTVSLRLVTLGPAEGEWTSVRGNLRAGEQVVTDGADRLRDGTKVQVVVAPTAAQDAAAAASSGASAARRAMERLSPEQQARVRAMSPDERRAFFQKLRAERAGAGGAGGAAAPGGAAPAGSGQPSTAPGSTAGTPAPATPATPATPAAAPSAAPAAPGAPAVR